MSAQPSTTRRNFLKSAAAGAAVLTAVPGGVHAAGGDQIKVGLVGCGGRGTGAAEQALRADKNVKLVAMADAFSDRLEGSLKSLLRDEDLAAKIDVPPDRRFVGFDAYKQVIAASDVVLLATTPHFRPIHLRAAVDAGKHVFCEKPMAVDGPGVRAVIAACEEARKKNLSVVSGFCWRYHHGMRDTFAKVHEGQIGDVTALQCTYNTGPIWVRPRQPGWTDMEYQMRNWYYFTWLSGDFNVEQHCHSIDKMVWAMKNEPPVKAVGVGGRSQRTEEKYGNIYDHHSVVYEFANGVRCFSMCRQMTGTKNDVSDLLVGTKGNCHIDASRALGTITSHGGGTPWRSGSGKRRDDNMYQTEHDELFASIRAGKPMNDGAWMTKSTLMAIMGRMATYTGQVITWEMALNSKENLAPPKYDWNVALATPQIAVPGVTKFA